MVKDNKGQATVRGFEGAGGRDGEEHRESGRSPLRERGLGFRERRRSPPREREWLTWAGAPGGEASTQVLIHTVVEQGLVVLPLRQDHNQGGLGSERAEV